VFDEPTPALPARRRITLLGRVVIDIDGAPLALAPSSLQVFVRLILARGGLIRIDELYRDVWVDELSKVDRDARTKIQKRITDLRQSLGAGANQIVPTEPGPVTGYRAAVDLIDVDAYRFEDLVTEPTTGGPEKVADRLERALALWRDRPLLGLGDAPFVRAAAAHLRHLRDLAAAGLVEACTQVGRPGDALGTITRLISLHPADTGLRELAQRAGTAVVPQVSAPPAAPPPAPRTRALPHVWNVPIQMHGFLPRPELLAQARQAVQSARLVLHGVPGVGKTRLAIEYPHQFASGYDVVWWLNAERAVDIGDQLGELAVRAGAVPARTPTAARVAAAKAYLRGLEADRWLVIVDNAEDARSIGEWLPDGDGHVLITSRNPHWWQIAAVLSVGVFTRTESVSLLQQWLVELSEEDARDRSGAGHHRPGTVAGRLGRAARARRGPAGYRRRVMAARGGWPEP
jgi:DNA-binding SARP family transcriptional activator